jgi:DNA modification methylase
VTKEPRASLARDTAHSRPHRVLLDNDFDIFAALPNSLKHVLKALDSTKIIANSTTYHGDARQLDFIEDDSIDAILTSPPYLNAIDYMRGHKFSLVWFGYTISQLRNIRSEAIGSEKAIDKDLSDNFSDFFDDNTFPKTDQRLTNVIRRYFVDLCLQLIECFRVLKPTCIATFVIGNSELKGQYIPNNKFLKKAATIAGFELISEETREIPYNRRYLPIMGKNIKSLSKRMRSEHIISFKKPSY